MIVTVVLPQRAPFSSAQLLVQFPRLRKNVSTAQSAVAHPIYECIQSNTQIGQCSVLQNLREPCIAAIKPLRPLRIVSVARCIIEESEWGVSEVFGPHKKRRQVLPPSPPPLLSHTEITIQKQHILIIRYPSKI